MRGARGQGFVVGRDSLSVHGQVKRHVLFFRTSWRSVRTNRRLFALWTSDSSPKSKADSRSMPREQALWVKLKRATAVQNLPAVRELLLVLDLELRRDDRRFSRAQQFYRKAQTWLTKWLGESRCRSAAQFPHQQKGRQCAVPQFKPSWNIKL